MHWRLPDQLEYTDFWTYLLHQNELWREDAVYKDLWSDHTESSELWRYHSDKFDLWSDI